MMKNDMNKNDLKKNDLKIRNLEDQTKGKEISWKKRMRLHKGLAMRT